VAENDLRVQPDVEDGEVAAPGQRRGTGRTRWPRRGGRLDRGADAGAVARGTDAGPGRAAAVGRSPDVVRPGRGRGDGRRRAREKKGREKKEMKEE